MSALPGAQEGGEPAAARRRALDDLAELTQELGLYDDPPSPEEVSAAVEAARHELARLTLAGTDYNRDTPIRQGQPSRYDGGASCPFCGRAAGTCRHRSGGPA